VKVLKAAWVGVVAVLMTACTANPVSQADTFEQKAYALYGIYVIAQGRAATLSRDASVPQSVKDALVEADRTAYPVAESLVDAAITVGDIRTTLNRCSEAPLPDDQCVPTNQRRLENAVMNLSSIYYRAQPVLLTLAATVKGAK
jgi:hypothetical protein